MRWFRRESLPAEVAAVTLSKGEQMLCWCEVDSAAGYVVATTHRFLILPTASPAQEWPWDRVVHGQWEDGRLTITAPDADGVRRTTAITITEPGAIPLAVRERVSTTMVTDQAQVLPDGTEVRFIARKPIGGAQVRWTVMFAPDVDTSDSALRAAADEQLAELRETLGL